MLKTEFIYKQQILKMPDNLLKARDFQILTREIDKREGSSFYRIASFETDFELQALYHSWPPIGKDGQ